MREFSILFSNFFKIEWKTPVQFASAFLNVIISVFLCYLAIEHYSNQTWVALSWIIIIFSSLFSIGRAFLDYTSQHWNYLKPLASSRAIIASMMIYRSILMPIIITLSILFLYLVEPVQIAKPLPFFIAYLLGGIGLMFVFTLVSAIASKTSKSSALLPVLSLPIIIPILLIGIHATKSALTGTGADTLSQDILLLFLLDVIIFIMALPLFESTWEN